MYEQGSQFQPSAIEMVDGQTSPPQLLTEADLISLMEKHGIGRVQIHIPRLLMCAESQPLTNIYQSTLGIIKDTKKTEFVQSNLIVWLKTETG